MQTKNRIDFPLKIKAVSDSGEFSGYGSVFGVEDSYGDIVLKGAFSDSIKDHKAKGRMPAMLWQHDTSEPIGVYTKVDEDDSGLYVEGRLLIDSDPLAKRAHGHLKAGSLSGLSIGYTLPEGGWSYDKDKGVFALSKINLWEISLVTFPANDEARVSEVKRSLKAGESINPSLVERLLRDAGFSRQQAKGFMACGYKGAFERDAMNTLEDDQALMGELQNLIKKLKG